MAIVLAGVKSYGDTGECDYDDMVTANVYKFEQNPVLRDALKEVGEYVQYMHEDRKIQEEYTDVLRQVYRYLVKIKSDQ